jgi:ribosomal protein S18 acetylase RimI-like enzyme
VRRVNPADRTIRLARTDDLEAIASVHVEGWQWGYRGQLPDDKLDAIDREARRALWQRVLAGEFPDTDVFVAEQSDRVVGFVSAGPSRDADASEDDAEIYALYVSHNAAGSPAGHELLSTAIVALRERGAVAITLWALESNQRARRFYERAGFATDGASKTEPWAGVELREMRYRMKL